MITNNHQGIINLGCGFTGGLCLASKCERSKGMGLGRLVRCFRRLIRVDIRSGLGLRIAGLEVKLEGKD